MTTYLRRPTHYAVGTSKDSACGYTSMWQRGLGYTRDIEQVSCKRCRAWLKAHPKATVSA